MWLTAFYYCHLMGCILFGAIVYLDFHAFDICSLNPWDKFHFLGKFQLLVHDTYIVYRLFTILSHNHILLIEFGSIQKIRGNWFIIISIFIWWCESRGWDRCEYFIVKASSIIVKANILLPSTNALYVRYVGSAFIIILADCREIGLVGIGCARLGHGHHFVWKVVLPP